MWKALSAVVALILCLSFSGAAEAQQPGARGSGFFAEPSSSGDVNATYLTLGTSGVLNNERVLTPNATYFAVTDNGPGGTYQITLNTLPIAIGGSGATTAQGAVNNYLDGIAGAAAASGDIIYRNGSTWTRLAKGADGTFLTLASGLPSWGSSPAGAPADAEYVTLSSNAGLSNEVVLTAGTGISIGAGTATIAINSTVTTNSGSQTLTNKTLTSPIFSWNGGAGVQFNGSASNHLTFTWADWAGARAISVPDPGTTSATQVLLNRGNQTINGVMTFTGVPVISQITNTGTLTLPTSTDTLIGRATTDTLTNKTITSPIMSASIVLDQTTQDYTISWANPAAARAYEIRDVGADADFAMTHATATYTNGGLAYVGSGVINFTAAGTSGQTIISAGTSAPSWGTLGPGGGGTGITSYTAGDLLTVNDAGTLVKLAGSGTDGFVLTYNSANNPNVGWAASASGAPADATYWVGSANGSLSAEIIPSGGTGISVTAATGVIAVDSTVVLTTGSQTITGTKSFNNTALRVGDTANDHFVTIAPSSDEAANRTVSLPTLGGNHTLVTESATQTLTNKTIGVGQLSGAVSIANGGTNNGSLSVTAGTVYYADGTKIIGLAPGTDDQYLRMNGTTAVEWATLAGGGVPFGGSGAAGAIDPAGSVNFNSFSTSSSATQNVILQATTFQLDTAKILTIDTASEVMIMCTSTFDITGTITYTAAGGVGGTAAASNAVFRAGEGGGPGGGRGGTAGIGTSGSAGGGGSFGGAGGHGGGAATARVTAIAPTYWWSHEGGSGGAAGVDGGGTGSNFQAGAQGGSAFVVMAAGNVTINSGAIITCNAATAPTAPTTAGGGSGGGSGGGVLIASQGSITFSAGATINVLGTNGGNGTGTAGGGGGGGGGRRIFWADTVTNSGTTTSTTSSGGTATNNGGAGGAPVGTIIDGTPNLPLIVWSVDTEEGQGTFLALEQIHKVKDELAGVKTELAAGYNTHFPQREIAYAAAGNNLAMFSSYMNPNYMKAEEASITCDAEVSEAIKNAA